MKKDNRAALVTGILLIALGSFILLKELVGIDPFLFRSYGLVALGILWLARVLTVRPRRRLYPGFLILMLGLFYLGVEWDLVELSRATLVTALILIAGLAVFPSFLLGKKSLPFLANGVVLTITGILFWLYVDMDFPSFYYLETYWPVALVIIGAAYLLQATLSGRKPLNN